MRNIIIILKCILNSKADFTNQFGNLYLTNKSQLKTQLQWSELQEHTVNNYVNAFFFNSHNSLSGALNFF